MIAIIDYDAGNIKSVEKAFMYLNQEVVVTRDHDTIMKADKAVLPGVGSFGDAMNKLHEYNLVDTIHEFIDSGKPFLGICRSSRAKNLKVLKDLVFSRAGLRNLI